MMCGAVRAGVVLLAIGALSLNVLAEGAGEGEALVEEPVPAPADTRSPDPVLDALNKEFDRDHNASSTEGGGADESDLGDSGALDGTDLFRVFGVLCLVLGLIIGSTYLIRRYGGKAPILAGAQLGQVMGKIYLSPKHSLVYVRSGGRVLLIGMTPNDVNLVTEFDAETFEEQLNTGEGAAASPVNGVDFLSQMRAASTRMETATTAEDTDIDAIRGDLQRLQQFLEESKRDGEA